MFCPRARSLIFNCFQNRKFEDEAVLNASFVVRIFRYLRVLDLKQMEIASDFPSEIEVLVQLAFLSINGQFSHIPPSIAKLTNLETLVVYTKRDLLLLPNSIWNLQRLKYLHIRNGYRGRFSLESHENLSVLHALDRLSGIRLTIGDSMERILRYVPNVLGFKFQLFVPQNEAEKPDKVVVLDFLSKLESVHLSVHYDGLSLEENPSSFGFSLPANLKKLTLSDLPLTLKNISTIGLLPNLEVLKLNYVSIEGCTWEMKEGEFPKLRNLKLDNVDLVRWTADDHDLYLQKLVLHCCNHLEEMPSCLEYIPTLEMIEVLFSSVTVKNLARRIEEEQKNWGNSDLKVIII